jgi:hypothetical protein
MNGSKRLGSGTQEDPSHVVGDLGVGPVWMERALVRLAQAPGRPVEPLGLPQPFPWGHGAVPRELLRGRPIHNWRVAREVMLAVGAGEGSEALAAWANARRARQA